MVKSGKIIRKATGIVFLNKQAHYFFCPDEYITIAMMTRTQPHI